MMTRILPPALATALLAFLASATMHLFALRGFAPTALVAVLLIACAIVLGCIVAIVQYKVMFDERDWLSGGWLTLYEGVPIWSRAACAVVFLYVVLHGVSRGGVEVFALLMCVYAAASALLHSAWRQPWLISRMTCPNGHRVKYFNRFCAVCGADLPKRPYAAR